jgi:hypothetical protein
VEAMSNDSFFRVLVCPYGLLFLLVLIHVVLSPCASGYL